jgi:carboxymethylproline synthase
MERQTDTIILERVAGNVLVLALNAAHPHNPFSAEMEKSLAQSLRAANLNDDVQAVIITGGERRSFSVGGDFNEIRHFEGGREVDQWIEDILDMYTACLEVEKPIIAALDNYVIGIGFQLALCCDYRLATPRVQLIMPELKNGIACVLGQFMLDRMLGRAHMLRIVVEGEPVSIDECLRVGLINATCDPDMLLTEAHAVATRLMGYPSVAYRTTKQVMNSSFAQGLRDIKPVAQAIHRAAFKDRSAQRFMESVVRKA